MLRRSSGFASRSVSRRNRGTLPTCARQTAIFTLRAPIGASTSRVRGRLCGTKPRCGVAMSTAGRKRTRLVLRARNYDVMGIGEVKAVVMAGGEGSRLRPLTSNMPKPLVPVAGRPIMEHILLHLRRHQLRDVVATVQYLGASIRNYFGDGPEQRVALTYSVEDSPLGTAGSVMLARK